MGKRLIVLFAEDADTADSLRFVLDVLQNPGWHPSAEGPGRGEQRRWTAAETEEVALKLLHKISGKVEWLACTTVPEIPR